MVMIPPKALSSLLCCFQVLLLCFHRQSYLSLQVVLTCFYRAAVANWGKVSVSQCVRGSCDRTPFWSWLEGSQCHPPPQGGTCYGEMNGTPSPTVGPASSKTEGNLKKTAFIFAFVYMISCLSASSFHLPLF